MTDAATARPLRFCMITTFYPPYNFGGDGIATKRLADELARRGHTVDVIHCEDSYRLLAPRGPVRARDDTPGVTVHGLRSPFGFLSPLATHQTGRPLFKSRRIREILDAGFDVIHFHNISLVGGPGILFRGGSGRGVKLCTFHDYWAVCPTHVLFRFNRAPCETPQCLACTLVHRRPPQWWRTTGLLKKAARHVDTFIAPSRFIADKHREMGFDAPIVHLPHFVPEPEAAADRGADTAAEPYFLYVGRIEKVKGLQTLIPVVRRHASARLLVAGSGTWEGKLKRLAAGCGRIEFLGRKTTTELAGLYRGAAAVIVPTICFENQALVVIESLSHGTPVIVRRIGGMPELIEQSGGGVVYDADDELVAAMDRLLTDGPYRDELGRRGREAYQREWTADVHVGRYLALINRLAEAKQTTA